MGGEEVQRRASDIVKGGDGDEDKADHGVELEDQRRVDRTTALSVHSKRRDSMVQHTKARTRL